MSHKVAELMKSPLQQRNLGWLQKMLQAAVELELSTLPPYLCGQWALEDQDSDAAGIYGPQFRKRTA
jgi:hypothetical protein